MDEEKLRLINEQLKLENQNLYIRHKITLDICVCIITSIIVTCLFKMIM